MLTAERLRKLLDYSPDTGIFIHKRNLGPVKAGDEAGSPNKDGHICIKVDGRLYRAHRLAWLYVTGTWPQKKIDHRNNVRSDNRFDNLREATISENCCNSIRRRTNTAGHKNVSWYPKYKKWVVRVVAKGKRHFLGYFDDLQEASKVAETARASLHGEFCNHG